MRKTTWMVLAIMLCCTWTQSIAQEEGKRHFSDPLLWTLAERHAELEKQSKIMQDSLRDAYLALMKVKDQPPSSNQFIQEKREKEVADATCLFAKTISEPSPVYGWTVFATGVERTDSGKTVVDSPLALYTGRDGQTRGVLLKFVVQNEACLEKVKQLSTPCIIKVYGRYTGKRDTDPFLEDSGCYTLRFELDNVEDRNIPSLRR